MHRKEYWEVYLGIRQHIDLAQDAISLHPNISFYYGVGLL